MRFCFSWLNKRNQQTMSTLKLELQKAKTFLEEDQPNMVDLLTSWVNINSGSTNLPGLDAMANAITEHIATMRYTVERITPKPYATVDEWGSKASKKVGDIIRVTNRPEAPIQILFNGHMDTVYSKDSNFQTFAVVDDNNIQGPGVTDMKGGLVVMLKSLEAFEKSTLAKNIGWEILITSDEEIGSHNSLPFIQKSAQGKDLALIFESSLPDGSLIRNRKGSGVFNIKVKGKSAHVGRDFKDGRNAIIGMSEIISAIHHLNDSAIIYNVGNIRSGEALNVIPDVAYSQVNIRTDSADSEKIALAKLEAIIDQFNQKKSGLKAKYSGEFTRPSKVAGHKETEIFERLKACAQDLNMPELQWRDTGGCSDGNIVSNLGVPNIDNLGVCGDNIHRPDEYCIVSSILERSLLTTTFLLNLADSPLSFTSPPP